MIKFVYADALDAFPVLKDTMYKDRAWQFKERLGWDVSVDQNGHEMDEYDAKNPLYMIYELENGMHGGSMRLLPTTAETMVNDHFGNLTNGVNLTSPLIWECTRFCLSPNADTKTSAIAGAALMLAGLEMSHRFGVENWVGVFDTRMVTIYKRLGWCPEVLGTSGAGKDSISVGLWTVSEEAMDTISRKSNVTRASAEQWFDASFPVTLGQNAMVA